MNNKNQTDPSKTTSNPPISFNEKRSTPDTFESPSDDFDNADNVVSFSGKFSKAWDGAVEGASNFAHQAQDWATHAGENVTSTVKRHPMQSLAMGLGIGCLIGILLSRRPRA